jgi:hypothetical protein
MAALMAAAAARLRSSSDMCPKRVDHGAQADCDVEAGHALHQRAEQLLQPQEHAV